eukprot:363572-Chlamydomonas_euryale.AAC.4
MAAQASSNRRTRAMTAAAQERSTSPHGHWRFCAHVRLPAKRLGAATWDVRGQLQGLSAGRAVRPQRRARRTLPRSAVTSQNTTCMTERFCALIWRCHGAPLCANMADVADVAGALTWLTIPELMWLVR